MYLYIDLLQIIRSTSNVLARKQLHIPARADFLEQVPVFFSHHYVCWTSRNFGEIFPESPVLADQATRHLQNSNPNLLEHLSRRLDDCLNIVNIFLSRYEELNIPETLTTNIRRLVEELCSIHTHILNIIINKHDFVLNSNHPCFFLSAKPIYTEPGRPQLFDDEHFYSPRTRFYKGFGFGLQQVLVHIF